MRDFPAEDAVLVWGFNFWNNVSFKLLTRVRNRNVFTHISNYRRLKIDSSGYL